MTERPIVERLPGLLEKVDWELLPVAVVVGAWLFSLLRRFLANRSSAEHDPQEPIEPR